MLGLLFSQAIKMEKGGDKLVIANGRQNCRISLKRIMWTKKWNGTESAHIIFGFNEKEKNQLTAQKG